MKVFVRNIPADGLDLTETVSGESVGLVEEYCKILSPVVLKAHIDKAEEVVIATVTAQGRYEFACGFCLAPIVQERTDRFDLNADITSTTEFVDFTDDIRQELLLALSGIVKCRPDCKGLCPGCGVDLNRESCRCGDRGNK